MPEDDRHRFHRHTSPPAAEDKRDATNANYKVHRKVDDINYGACEICDLGEVERSLMQTLVYHEFGYTHSIATLAAIHNTKPSVVGVHEPGTNSGDWCVRTNALIYENYLTDMHTDLAAPVPPLVLKD